MPWYPQSNGQVETKNKTLLDSLKKQLKMTRSKWVDELFGVLWAYQSTNKWPTGLTPFALTYEMEVVIPTKIGLPKSKQQCKNRKPMKEILKCT